MKNNFLLFLISLFSVYTFGQKEKPDYTVKTNRYYKTEKGEKAPLRYGQKYSKNETYTFSEVISKDEDTPINKEVFSSVEVYDTKSFADRMVGASPTSYTFLQKRSSTTDSSFTYRYIPSNIKDFQKYSKKKVCKDCMDIEFKKDLNNDQYNFSNVWGTFSDLFPVWKSLFYPNAQQSDYQVSDQNIKAEWKIIYNGKELAFGRLGEVWFIIMKQ